MAVDPFDDFEFQPLTEGLGFHKKAEKIKTDIQSSQLAKEKITRSVPEAPPRSILSASSTTSSTKTTSISASLSTSLETDSLSTRPATQSISELIASLPPSLDFLEDKEEASKASPLTTPLGSSSKSSGKSAFDSAFDSTDVGSRPQIFQPLGRDDYRTTAGGSMSATSMPSSSLNPPAPTVGTFLPSPGTKAGGSPTLGAPSVPVVPAPAKPSSPYRERMDESFARAFPHAEKTKREQTAENEEEIQAIPTHPVAALLDGMVAAGITTILLVAVIAITRINLVGMLSNPDTAGSTQLNLVLLFLAVIQMYMLTARSFFGATLGEWAFDLQLGSSRDQRATWYPVRVAWRMIAVTLTGLIVLPLISLLARRDLLKYLTGLQLYRRP